jgi:predicted amidohydrolase
MRLALDQWRPVTGGPAEGLARLDRAAGAAALGGADLLVLPEMALTGYNIGAAAAAAAAEPEGGTLDAGLAAAARRQGIAILAGYPRRDAEGRVLNAARLVDRDGATRATYAKTHLYGAVDRAQFAAGPGFAAVAELAGWRLGLAVCYDIEFPETARLLALAGAEAILVPTANMAPFESVALRVVPTRAEENAVYVAYANYCGAEPPFAYVGLSCVSGPDGEDVARAGSGEETIFADLDRAALAAARARATHLADRRPELYAPLALPGGPS